MAIVVNNVNVYQLTDKADGTPQVKTEAQRLADSWPPPDGTAHIKSPDYIVKEIIYGSGQS